MNQTYTSQPYTDNNYAHAYTTLSDGNAVEQKLATLKGGDAFNGSGRVRSCVKDLTVWCKALIEASKAALPAAEESSGATSSALPDLPGQLARNTLLEARRVIQQPQIPLTADPKQA